MKVNHSRPFSAFEKLRGRPNPITFGRLKATPKRAMFDRRASRIYREFEFLENILLCNLRSQKVNPKEINHVIQKWRKLSSRADSFLLDTLDANKIDSRAGEEYRHKLKPLSSAILTVASVLQLTKPSKLTLELKRAITAVDRPSTAKNRPKIK